MKWIQQFRRFTFAVGFTLPAVTFANLPTDLQVSQSAAPDPAPWLSPITYTVTVSNAGPSVATAIQVTDTLPPGVSFIALSGAGGVATHSNGVVRQSIESLAAGTAATLLIQVLPLQSGALQNKVVVSAAELDFVLGNNSNALATTVSPPLSGSASLYFSSATAATGALALTLAGPANAYFFVEETTDFIQWSSITNLFSGTGQAVFSRPTTGQPPQRLFRAASTLLPIPRDDSAAVRHDDVLQVPAPGVLGNDSFGANLTGDAELVSSPAHGTLTLSSDGSYRYTPLLDYMGADSFVYRITGAPSNGATATVSIQVTNQPPTAVADVFGVHSNLNLVVSAPGVLRNDLPGDSDTLTASLATNALHGVVTLLSDGSFVYQPSSGYAGGDQFAYSASDGVVQSTAVVTLTVHATKAPPLAVADNYLVTHDQALSRSAATGLLANDIDSNSDPLTATLVSPPTHGTVTVFPDGSFDYFPTNNYLGPDSFTYRAHDGLTFSAPATVSLLVSNTAPVAVGESYALPPNTAWSVAARGVLRNDADANGDPSQATLVTGPAHGALVFPGDGSFEYQPATNFTGSDSFTYAAYDAFATSAPVVVSLVVSNHAPAPVADVYGVHAGLPLNVPAPGVLANDLDADGDTITAQKFSNPAHGILVFNADGSFNYTPSDGYFGADGFSYFVSDGLTESSVVTVTLNVHAPNSPPTGAHETYALIPNEPLVIEASLGVLENDQDAEGDFLVAQPLSGCTNGIVSLNTDGGFTYIPNTGFVGVDGFTYRVFDGVSYSAVVPVGLQVLNQPPEAPNDFYQMHAGTVLTVLPNGVLDNDGDQDFDLLTAELASLPALGVLTFTNDGSFAFAAPTGFVGTVTFSYRAFDGVSYSPTGAVQIVVTNEVPQANDDHYTVHQNGTLSPAALSVLDNDFDLDGDSLQAVVLTPPTHAAVFSLPPDGQIAYTPTPGYVGPDAFTYRAFDGVAFSEPVTVALTVTDRPIGAEDFYVYSHTSPLIVPAAQGVLTNDFDSVTALTAALAQPPAFGAVSLHADGSFEYTPDPLHSGEVTFSYNVSLGGVAATLPVLVVLADVPPKLILDRLQFLNGFELLRDTPEREGVPFHFDAPHWRDGDRDGVIDPKKGERQYGHIFQRKTKPKVTAIFYAEDTKAFKGKKVSLRGTLKNKGVALNITVEGTGKLDEKDKHVWLEGAEAGGEFEDKVNCYDPLEIEWTYSFDGQAWNPAGTCKNLVYLTFGKPEINLLFETVMEYGSRSAKGADKKETVRDRIWEEFSVYDATRKDGKALGYYRNWNTTSANTLQLLATLDGQCTSWADFLNKCLDAQGLGMGIVRKIVPTESGKFFLVKNWKFPAKLPFDGVSTYPKPPKFGMVYPDEDGENQRYLWSSEVVSDQPGIPGQNSANPTSLFNNHVVVKIGAEYYDPSYGVIHKGLMEIQDGALDGFYTPKIDETANPPKTTFKFEHKQRPKEKKEQLRLKETGL